MRTKLGLLASVLVLVSLPQVAWSQPEIDGQIRAALSLARLPEGRPCPMISGARALPVTLVLEREADAATLAALERLEGVWLRRIDGRPIHRGRIVSALVSARGLGELARQPGLVRVTLGVGRGPLPPLDYTTGLVGIEAARRTWNDGHWLTGQGMLLADIDTNVDIFHPDFFAADGGIYDWIDVDGDGELSFGRDAIDLDGDGLAGEDEVARVLTAEIYGEDLSATLPIHPSRFSALRDWVYIDTNLNYWRDFGPNEGFDDATPAFGEPLFVVDDIDGDDRLDPGERLLRLSTSRIRAVYVSRPSGAIRVYRRGENLTDLPDSPFGYGAYGLPEAMHATGVLSIAAGGVPGLGRPLTGFAPEAELVVAYDGSWDLTSSLIWALDEGAQVVLHEYAPWVGVTLDGSDSLSELIDESTDDDGVIHVCPVGNTGGARKHTMVTLAPGETASLGLEVPYDGFEYLGVSLHWRPGEADPAFELVLPSGDRYDLRDIPGSLVLEEIRIWVSLEISPGGTGMLHFQADGSPPSGMWRFEVVGDPELEVTMHGYVQDELSGWGEGIAWERGIATDVSNIGLPSTAASCLAVGATTGHAGSRDEPWFGREGAQGEVRSYSGRGPRIDGWPKPDLTGPDNPFAAFPRWADYGFEPGAYWIFGGTSGAGPHVAGAALLLRQVEPEGSEVIARLIEGVEVDDLTGETPNPDYGNGRVSLWGALGLEPGAEPPILVLEAPARGAPGETVTVHPVVEDPDGVAEEVEIRWVLGYDGVWEGAFGVLEDLELELPAEEGRVALLAQARDASGLTARAVAWIDVVTVEVDAGPDGGGESDGAPEAGPAPRYRAGGGLLRCDVSCPEPTFGGGASVFSALVSDIFSLISMR
jgi:subtilisin family serine protease